MTVCIDSGFLRYKTGKERRRDDEKTDVSVLTGFDVTENPHKSLVHRQQDYLKLIEYGRIKIHIRNMSKMIN